MARPGFGGHLQNIQPDGPRQGVEPGVFGDRVATLPVTSVKGMLGHCLGAAGGVEAAVLALSIDRGVIPPTIHHSDSDADVQIDVVANQAREQRLRCAVSTSLAFGGNDSAIVMTAL